MLLSLVSLILCNNIPRNKLIQDMIGADAYLEFKCVWREHESTGIHT